MKKMERPEVEAKVFKCIEQVAQEQAIAIGKPSFKDRVVDDLGFKSLDVGTLTALLEMEFGIDPFATGVAVVTEIVTIGDICDLYDRCVNGVAKIENANPADEASDRMKRRLKRAS